MRNLAGPRRLSVQQPIIKIGSLRPLHPLPVSRLLVIRSIRSAPGAWPEQTFPLFSSSSALH